MDLLKQKNWFDSPQFQEEFHCDLPLGSFCSPSGTIFRLWAPTAQDVTLSLYWAGNDSSSFFTVSLQRQEKGLWSYQTDKNLHGVYYDYYVTVEGATRQTADPYAKACGVNGLRSMVIDLRKTDPEGWAQDAAPAPPRRQSFTSSTSRISPGTPPAVFPPRNGDATPPCAAPAPL